MNVSKMAVLAMCLSFGCATRTAISPVTPKVVTPENPAECAPLRYESATDLPPGAKSLGRVSIPRGASEGATVELLGRKVCDMGGDAFSQLKWEHPSGPDDAPALTANVWELP